MLLLAFLAGWMMYAEPWNSRQLQALLRDPVGVFTHGVAVGPSSSRGSPAPRLLPAPARERAVPPADPVRGALQERVRAEPSPCAHLLQSGNDILAWKERERLDSALYQALLCKVGRPSYQELYRSSVSPFAWLRHLLLQRKRGARNGAGRTPEG